MKSSVTLRTAVLALGLAVLLAGCAPRYYPPPLPSPPRRVAPTPQAVRPVFYIKANHLNLRACPGMDCPKVSLLERGEEVEKVGESEDWFQIRIKRDGRLGWVDSRYLSSTPPTQAPEAAPPPPPTPAPVEVAPPPLPERIQPPPLPARPVTPALPTVEKPPKPPAQPAEEVAPPAKKKPEEAKPAKPVKAPPAGEAVQPTPKPEKPAPKKEVKPAPPPEKPAPPPEPESGNKKIRIM